MPAPATIGYENATLDDVIARLKAAGIAIVIDVRAVASSRRPGFSKTMLAASLAAQGIGYLHLRALGTPKPGREAARAGRIGEMREIFERHMATPEAVDALAHAIAVASEKPAAMLCYEADAAGCHRRVLAEKMEAALGPARDL